MSTRNGRLPIPNRIQEDIQIYNLSLPLPVPTSVADLNSEYEPELAELCQAVECYVCRCVPKPPIYNCMNGHFSCSLCLPRLPEKRCAYCSAKFTNMRNYPLESIVTSRVFLCDFRNVGCKTKDLTMAEYEDHMATCWFRPLMKKSDQHSQGNNIRDQGSSRTLLREFSCPRCSFMNSKRKVKCQNCEINLRVATPMCSRPARASSEYLQLNDEDNSATL